MKKVLLILLILTLTLALFAACGSFSVETGKELVSEGSFENNSLGAWTLKSSSDDSALPEIVSWANGSDDYKEAGEHSVKFSATKFQTYSQRVKLQKNSVYYLSALVKVTNAITSSNNEALAGAFVAIDSDYATASDIVKSASGWKKIGVYFNSAEQSVVEVRFGVGTAAYNASGTALFDSISLVKVDNAPSGVLVTNLTRSASSDSLRFDVNYRTNGTGVLFTTLTAVLGAALLFAAYAVFRSLMAKKDAFLTPELSSAKVPFFKSAAFFLILCEILGFAVRLIVVNFVYGGPGFGTYVSEATKLADLGAKTYYFGNTVTTPIGSLYLLWVLGLLSDPLKLVSGTLGFAIFIKIPAILADLVAIFVVFYLANRKYNQFISATFAGTYALFPLFFFASSGWGVYSSIGALFILLSLISILDKKYVSCVVYYSLSLLFLAEALLLAPLFLIYLFYVFFKTDDYKMAISISITSSVIVLYLLSLPFIFSYFASGRPFVVVARYCQAMLVHTGFTENAFTIYGFFGLAARKASVVSYVFNGILVGLSMIYALLLFFKSRSRLDLILLSAFIFATTFVLTSAVDSFMIYPALILLLAYGIVSSDRRVLKLFGGFSLTSLLNATYAMMIGGYFGSGTNSAAIFMSAGDPVLIVFSVLNFLLLAYFAYVTYSLCVKEEIKGVVIIEGNYFKFAAARIKKCGEAIKGVFSKKNKEQTENAGENK
ncbi:MAG: hypothetical protein K5753_01050 [Clostridia bacterium]|nr:hypothetical protein [Clostridia bacterium]